MEGKGMTLDWIMDWTTPDSPQWLQSFEANKHYFLSLTTTNSDPLYGKSKLAQEAIK